MPIGVLALQGDFREHKSLVESLGLDAVKVRRVEELGGVDGLIIPGGESTAISNLAQSFGLVEPIRAFAKKKPVLGTCAGLIMLSDSVLGATRGQEFFGGLPIETSRNAYGGQLSSFEAQVSFVDGSKENVAFIRAPKILSSRAETLATLNGEIVAVRQGNLFGASFHPEITGAKVLHRLFLSAVEQNKQK